MVVVNNDPSSSQYRQWEAFTLSDTNRLQVLVPPNFGNGHLVMSERAIFPLQAKHRIRPRRPFTLLWNDPALKIWWPVHEPDRLGARPGPYEGLARLRLQTPLPWRGEELEARRTAELVDRAQQVIEACWRACTRSHSNLCGRACRASRRADRASGSDRAAARPAPRPALALRPAMPRLHQVRLDRLGDRQMRRTPARGVPSISNSPTIIPASSKP